MRPTFPLALLVLAMLPPPLAAAPRTHETRAGDRDPAPPWTIELRQKRYISSHTSYEFGNPFPPNQTPLSRLEFPMDSWWTGLEVRRRSGRFSFGLEALRNFTQQAPGVFKDSDWDEPGIKTVYSESRCRVTPGWDLRADLDVALPRSIGLPRWLDVRPVVGFRWQRLHFATCDGVQYDLVFPGPGVSLPGDGIHFKQDYRQYFGGLKTTLDLGRLARARPVALTLQADLARVEGSNEDHHLLRIGNRYTYERTTGTGRHVQAGLSVGVTRRLRVGLDVDYLAITSTGSHRLVNDMPLIDFGFEHGVKVWSDQTSLTARVGYSF